MMEEIETNLNLNPNVIDGEELEDLFNTVFSQMAFYVSRTYGPFGENTGYQMQDKILTTKDGWTVEQGVIYSNNMLANLIRKLIIEVSRSINVHAGDGTTTGVIAANEVNRLMMQYKKNNKIHSKFLSAAMKYCVEKICNELNSSAVKITDDNMDDLIYRIAEVSLDWDKEFAGYIRDIYRETKNPIIRVQNSGFESSYVEYMNGFDLSGKLISEFKVNNLSKKSYKVSHPFILVFSYTITANMFEELLTVASYFNTNGGGRELVILAPDFEKDFRDNYNAINIRMAKMNKPIVPMVLVRYFAEYNIEREMVNDFCFLTGANMISKEYNEAMDVIRNFVTSTKVEPPNAKDYEHTSDFESEMDEYYMAMASVADKFNEEIGKFIGTCDELEASDKNIVAIGFNGFENSQALEDRRNVIRAEIDKATKDMTAKSMFTDEIKLKRLRLGKLQLKTGIINVGGFGENNLKATRDALDDAINACSNAYLEGVVVGGGIAIPTAINNLLEKLNNSWNPEEEKGIDNSLVEDILVIFLDAFINTWEIMLSNRYGEGHIANSRTSEIFKSTWSLIDSCLKVGKPWNLITEDYDDSIIHPVKVETEVIKGCLHLVLLTTTTNQLLYSGYQGIDKELEGMREVKDEE
jgi:chaperonin GroEL (HSP60 family)